MTVQEYINLKQSCNVVIQNDSRNHEAYYQRGNCCTNLNELAEAISDFSVAIDLINIEVMETELELEEEPELLIEEINNLQDNIVLYYLSRAMAFIDNNMYKEALEDLNYVIEKSIKIINDEDINKYNISNINIADDKNNENNENSEDIADIADDEDFEIYEAYIQQIIIYYSVRGVVYNKLNQFDKAIADFNSSINLSDKILMYKDTQVASFYKERALTYLHTKEFDLALEDLNSAISLDAQQDVYYYMRAMTNIFKNEVDNNTQAIKDLDLAIKLNPKKIIYYTIKADLLIKLDKKEEAVNSIPENLYYFRAIYYKKIFQWDNCVEEILKGLNTNAVIPENFKALKDILINIDFNKYKLDNNNIEELKKDLIKLFVVCEELKNGQLLTLTEEESEKYISYYTELEDINYLFSSKDNLKFKLKNNTNNNFGDFMLNAYKLKLLDLKTIAKNSTPNLLLSLFSQDNLNIRSNTYTSSFYSNNSENPYLWFTKTPNSNGLKIDIPMSCFKNYNNLEYNIDNMYKVINDEEILQVFNNIKLNTGSDVLLYNVIYFKVEEDAITMISEYNKQDQLRKLFKEIMFTLLKLDTYQDLLDYNSFNNLVSIINCILEQVAFLFKINKKFDESKLELVCAEININPEKLSLSNTSAINGVPEIFANIEKEIEYSKLKATIGMNVKGIREVADYLNYLGFNNIKKSELN